MHMPGYLDWMRSVLPRRARPVHRTSTYVELEGERLESAYLVVRDEVSRTANARRRLADGTYRVRCSLCGAAVSNALPLPADVRALVICLECVERREADP